MKLAKIEITHFRCFESLALNLHPEVNVIVGANGAGKTSILDAIAIALYEIVAANGGGARRQRTQQHAALLPTDILVEPGAADALVGRKHFVQFRATAEGFYAVDGFPNTTPQGRPAALEWTEHIQYQPPASFIYDTTRSERISSVHRYFQALWREIENSSAEALIPLPVVAYYRAHRRVHANRDLGDVFALELSRAQAFSGALDAGADFQAVCQWFYLRENAELRARASGGASRDPEFADLSALRRVLANTIEGVERVFFDGNPPRLKVARRPSTSGPRTLELSQLSDGYRSLIALVLDFARRLAQAHPRWPNPLEAPGILVVDELELHLHPVWQQKVIPSLRAAFPNAQLIVSTHSPSLLTTVERGHVHLLGANHAFEQIPSDVGTYGAETSRVLTEVFGAYARPQTIDSVHKLQEYLSLIEERKHESVRAITLRSELERALGASDPDLKRADVRISQLRSLGKR